MILRSYNLVMFMGALSRFIRLAIAGSGFALFAITAPAIAQSFKLLTPALPDATVGTAYVGNLMLSGVTENSTVTLTGLPAGLTATHNGKGSIAISGNTNAIPATYPLTIRATTPPNTTELSTSLRLLQTAETSIVNIVSLATGRTHSCAAVNGGVQCWGQNDKGQLGNTSITSTTSIPVPVIPSGSNVTKVASGYDHTCAIVDGGLQCWGENGSGQIGNGSTVTATTPVTVIATGSGVTDVATGKTHTCAVIDGGVQCWGANTLGELGTRDNLARTSPAVTITAKSGVTAISVGYRHSCAIVSGGVQCWGYGNNGALGNNDLTNQTAPISTIAAGSDVRSIAVGGSGACAVVGGGVRCWGANDVGQVGNELQGSSWTPSTIFAANSGVSSVTGSETAFCALVNSGLQCWGSNVEGRLGTLADVTRKPSQVFFSAGSNLTAHAVAAEHACVLVGGAMQCWGNAAGGRLGTYGVEYTRPPVQVAAAGSSTTHTSGGSGHSCIVSNGGVTCWGDNAYGQLGNGTTTSSLTPVQAIATGSGATWVSAGVSHTCAVVAGGVRCWGRNHEGQLGNGTQTDSSTAVVAVPSTEGAEAVAAGSNHTCALVGSSVRCWGNNENGQLGNAFFTPRSTTQITVIGAGERAAAIAVGPKHSCAALEAGVKCWGDNANGQLGDGTTTSRTAPTLASGTTSGATAIATSSQHTCMVRNQGLSCWGANTSGQLGNGTTVNSTSAVEAIAENSSVTAVAVGTDHTCVIASGGIRCWGSNSRGQLGDVATTTTTTTALQTFAANSGMTSISAGSAHTCATILNGALCWGDNTKGQLGQPIATTRSPSTVRFYVSTQSITFAAPADTSLGTGSVSISASSTSNLTVTFTSLTPEVCSISGGVVRLLAVGTCTIAANQAGNISYAAAAQVQRSFSVLANTQSISFTAPPTTPVTAGSVSLSASATSGLAVSYASSTPSVCTVSGSTVTLLAVGTCGITATQAGNASYAAATPVSVSFSVILGTQSITFATPSAQNLSAGSLVLSATASSGLSVSYTTQTPNTCTTTGQIVTLIAVGTCTITASQTGNGVYAPATDVTVSFQISAATQSISFLPIGNQLLSAGNISVTATASSGLPVVITSQTPSVCTVTGNAVSLLAVGTCTLIANQPGNVNVGAATPVTQSFQVQATAQTIIFSAISSQPLNRGSVALTATASSGLPVTFATQTPSICGVNGSNATLIAVGTCTIIASQAGNSSFAAADPVSQSFSITPSAQTITFTGIAAQLLANGSVSLVASATSGLPITFATQTPTTCGVNGSTATLIAVGTCTITATQTGSAAFAAATPVSQSFTIAASGQTISFASIATQFLATGSVSLSASASSGLPVSFASQTTTTCTVNGSTATLIAIGTCTIVASQAGNATFAAATPVTQSFSITTASQTISFQSISAQSLSSGGMNLSATSSAGLTVVFTTLTTSVCTVSGVRVTFVAAGTCTISAAQPGNTNVSAATPVTQSFEVIAAGDRLVASIALASSKNPSNAGESFVLIATVTGRAPSGAVNFVLLRAGEERGLSVCANVALSSPIGVGDTAVATAACVVSAGFRTSAQQTYVATYSGNAANAPATASIQQSIGNLAANVNATVSPAKPFASQPLILTATVAGNAPNGTVSFFDNGSVLPGCSARPVSQLPGASNRTAVATCNVAPNSLPIGDRSVLVSYSGDTSNGASSATLNFTVSPAASGPSTDYSDLWWAGSSENGWGMSISQRGGVLFNAFYIYDSRGKPTWIVMPGGTWNPDYTTFSGALYMPTSAPLFDYSSSAFVPGPAIGNATLTFRDANNATLNYSINSSAGNGSGSKSISRQPFGPPDSSARLIVNGLWWNPSENGWGIAISQQSRTLFATWYTYDTTGKAAWYVLPGGNWDGAVFTGDLYATTGSAWIGAPYNPNALTVTKVGTLSLSFADAENAVMTYTINGVTQSKTITRQLY